MVSETVSTLVVMAGVVIVSIEATGVDVPGTTAGVLSIVHSAVGIGIGSGSLEKVGERGVIESKTVVTEHWPMTTLVQTECTEMIPVVHTQSDMTWHDARQRES